MGLIDSHAHLTHESLASQVDDVLERCALSGVDAVITVGTDPADADHALALARRYSGRVFAAVGVHPHEAGRVGDDEVAAMAARLEEPGVVAFGEMGLDYHYDFAERGRQREVFAAQLAAAAVHDTAVIIHCREAFSDTLPLLLEAGLRGRRVVFHCFTGTADEAREIARCGWRISFTGVVTFKSSTALRAIAREYPAEQLMVETDAPYLSPAPVRGQKPNTPANVAHVARFLADLRGVRYEALVDQTRENTIDFFGLPC